MAHVRGRGFLMAALLVPVILVATASCASGPGSAVGAEAGTAADGAGGDGFGGGRFTEIAAEPQSPRDGSTVTMLPLRIVMELDEPSRSAYTLALYTDPERPEESRVHTADALSVEDLSEPGVRIPDEILVDGTRYYYRLEGGTEAVSELFSFSLALSMEVPDVLGPSDGTVTFDRTPLLRVAGTGRFEFELQALDPDSGEPRAGSGRSRRFTGGGETPVPEPLDFGSARRWRVRRPGENGPAGPWSEWRSFRVFRDFTVEPVSPGYGLPSISLRPYVAVTPVPGAAEYRFELYRLPVDAPASLPAGQALLELSTADAHFTVGEVPGPESLVEGASYAYRVRPANDSGDRLDWFGPFAFRGGATGVEMQAVLRPGEVAEFSLGGDQASPGGWEAPFAVRLTRPFAMAERETTNRDFARVLNWALASGRARVAGERIVAVPDPGSGEEQAGGADPVVLLYLEDLLVGRQFGLTIAPDPPRLEPLAGREDHPVVGVTWHGAIAFANYYSILSGRPPVYDLETGAWDRDAAGYRLPTEAEWAYAAGGAGDLAFPWGGPLLRNRANYFRSGDPFEAPTPPFTGAGGPTTPAGFYDGSNRGGYATRSNASAEGVYDLVGNVWEWCYDWYARDPGTSEDQQLLVDPAGPEEPERDQFGVVHRVVRGTGWNTRVEAVRLRNRGRFDPGEGSYATGFRLIEPLSGSGP